MKNTGQNTPSLDKLPSERGFTLIEMMISLVIGLMIVAALVSVLISNSQSSKTNERTSELQSNGRYALDHLKRELLHAGYIGYFPKYQNSPQSGPWSHPTITNECGTPLNFVKNIRQAVWGANDNNPFSGDCLSASTAKYNTTVNSDVLVIRHASSIPTLKANEVANTLYVRSSYNSISLEASPLPADVPTVENFALQVYVYYIGTDDNDATIPALRRLALVNYRMEDQMVVSGIEHMQIEYGTTVAGNTRYFTADNIAGSHSSNVSTGWDGVNNVSIGWDDVNSVRVWLLVRNSKAETGYTNTTLYSWSNLVYPVNDNFRRQIFTTVVQLRNFRD